MLRLLAAALVTMVVLVFFALVPATWAKPATVSASPKRDSTPPTAPTNLSASVSGSSVALNWTASTDNVAVSGYRVYRGGSQIATVSSSSYTNSGLAAGTYSYTVRAYDKAGNLSLASNTVSATIASTVDTQAPLVSFTSPGSGATVQGLLSDTTAPTLCEVAASDNVGVTRVDFFVDGGALNVENLSPWNCTWDTTKFANGSHTITAKAYDVAGNMGSAAVTVNVSNGSSGSVLVWSDEFTGTAGSAVSSTKWNAINWCDRWGSLSCNTNRSQNISLDGNGHLKITAIKENYTDPYGNTGSWTAARAESKYKFRYGKLQASIMVPAGRGLWPAFWGVTDKASNGTYGEYDVMEILGHEPDRSYCTSHGWPSSVHWATATSQLWGSGLSTGYHLYEMIWAPGSITYKLDGVVCATHTPTTAGVAFWPFDIQGNILVGMAVGGSWPGNPDSTTPSVASMYVDWVRVYQ